MKFKILAILVAIMLASILLVSCDTEEQMTNSPSEFNDVGTESPAPTEPTPTEPAPTEPAPTEPTPTEPTPTEPTPTEPHVHSYGEWIVKTPAECETNGVEERVCTCGESETRPIPATGHSYGEWGVKTSAGCETNGVEERVCTCGKSETRPIPATGHSYGEWGVKTPAECETNGVEERVCTCGKSETRPIPATGHSYGEWGVKTPAGCETNGVEERVCTCGESETRPIPATGHSYGEWGVKTSAGCETNGVEERVCTCGESETRSIPATGHSYGEWDVKTPAECEAEGVEERVCTCGESETRPIPATGHSYGEWIVKTPAECETNGVEERVCTCGESETRPIPATGHKYAETLSYDSTSHFYAAVCGCADQKKDAEPHIDTNNDGKCEVCAYDKMPVDTTVDKFSDIMQNMFLGNTVYSETVMFIDYGDEKSLLFTPDRILSVKSFDEKTVYVEGKDYVLRDGKLVILAGSSIPCITSAVYANGQPFAGIQLKTYINGVLTNTYWGEGNSMIKYQVKVDYEHSGVWEGFKQLTATDQYKNFIGKLERGEKVTVYFHGDSITVGANASGFVGAEPYEAPYPVLFVDALARLYGYSVTQPASGGHNRYNLSGMDYSNGDTNKVITYINTAVGGDNSQAGASKIRNYINNVYAQYGCDLFIVAYGMNDGGNSPQTFTRANIKSIIDTVLAKNPDAAVMMISTMVPNPNAPAWNGLQREQEEQLLSLAEEYRQRGVGCAVAQMTSVSVTVLEHKEFVDVTGNNINHPNDFLIRLYAQTMIQTLLGYENIV